MRPPLDQDGKSQTASAVNGSAYPEQNQMEQEPLPELEIEEVRARAHQIWVERGSPEGSAEEDWEQAEREVRARLNERADLLEQRQSQGSVQR